MKKVLTKEIGTLKYWGGTTWYGERQMQIRYDLGSKIEWREKLKDGSEVLHRLDGPAIEWDNNQKQEYWYNDQRQEWWYMGKRHREGGPALIFPGREEWYFDGLYHREGGPAVIHEDGYRCWCYKGLKHRVDGPAREWDKGNRFTFNGVEMKEWWLNDIHFDSEEKWFEALTEEDKLTYLFKRKA